MLVISAEYSYLIQGDTVPWQKKRFTYETLAFMRAQSTLALNRASSVPCCSRQCELCASSKRNNDTWRMAEDQRVSRMLRIMSAQETRHTMRMVCRNECQGATMSDLCSTNRLH